MHWSSSPAVRISNFVRAARLVGLEVLAELDLDDDYALDEELIVEYRDMASPPLYATMPTGESFERLLRLYGRDGPLNHATELLVDVA